MTDGERVDNLLNRYVDESGMEEQEHASTRNRDQEMEERLAKLQDRQSKSKAMSSASFDSDSEDEMDKITKKVRECVKFNIKVQT